MCVGLVMAAVAVAQQRGEGFGVGSGSGFAPRGPAATAAPMAATGSELIVAPMALGEKTQMLTVVDPRHRVVCVYHIDAATGKIALKSARNIQWDLQINNFNNEAPLPQQIQSMSDQR